MRIILKNRNWSSTKMLLLPTNCMSVLDDFVWLALEGSNCIDLFLG